MTESQTLYHISLLDREVARAKKALDNLPEAAQIVECRAKRKDLKAKQDQVFELTDDVNAKLAKLDEEETALIAKLKELQAALDGTTDFRMTEKLTAEMEELVERQSVISTETDALLERQIKIDNLAAQVSDMLQNLDHKEHHLTEDFKEKGSEIKGQIDSLQTRVDAAKAELPAELLKRYEKLKEEKKGMPIAYFEGTHCSACHMEFQTGALAKIKAGPEVGECPNCHRIFLKDIVEG